MIKERAVRGVQSVELGGRILAVFADTGQALMLRDIASLARVTSAQAHAYLVSFRKFGLVEQDPSTARYQLGPFALQLGLARMRVFDPLRAATAATADLALELGLMVTVSVWGTFGPTIVQVQEAADQMHVNLRAGATYAIKSTATGQLFAAFMPTTVIKPHLERETREGRKSPRVGGPISEEDFQTAVAEIRRRGYGLTRGRPIPGIDAISAPVFDDSGQLRLAITVIGPQDALDVDSESPQVERVIGFASELSRQLGYDPARKGRAAPATTKADAATKSVKSARRAARGASRPAG